MAESSKPGVTVLQELCAARKIKAVEHPATQDSPPYLSVFLPGAKEPREIEITSDAEALDLVNSGFDEFLVLTPFVAVYRAKDGLIEAVIGSQMRDRLIPAGQDLRRIFAPPGAISTDPGATSPPLVLKQERIRLGAFDLSVEVSPVESEFCKLLWADGRAVPPREVYTFKVRGLTLQSGEAAKRVLRKLSASVFFHIDLARHTMLRLERYNPFRFFIRKRQPLNGLPVPDSEYDEIPMELYWYARSAASMPLLQFLAFYQVLEYYFPIHSQAEAARRLRTLLNDPLFDGHKEADLVRVIDCVKAHGGRGMGDEESQLDAVVRTCVSDDDVRRFLEEDVAAKQQLFDKNCPLSNERLNKNDWEGDVRRPIVRRIYDIRCRIVHAKADRRGAADSPLLPFSDEVALVRQENFLLEYLAQRALIYGSRKLVMD